MNKKLRGILLSISLFLLSFSFVAAADYDSLRSGCNGSLVQKTQTVGTLCDSSSYNTAPTCTTGSALITGTVSWNGISYGGCSCTCASSGLGTVQSASGLSTTSVPVIIGNVIKVILGLSGTVALVLVVAGGVKWMTSKGDEAKIKDARKLMINGAIGIIIIAAAYAITDFVIKQLAATV